MKLTQGGAGGGQAARDGLAAAVEHASEASSPIAEAREAEAEVEAAGAPSEQLLAKQLEISRLKAGVEQVSTLHVKQQI